ncbi:MULTISPECIES: DUF3152 domain-containing protein [Micromonospora]|uniref:DUF3152 domain-containing protein n=1 Tax=Micromonospora TaxID=1873 RepID=UPI0028053863|nr:DUF3152 domain-containing protein [Micromonospora yangpuensis]
MAALVLVTGGVWTADNGGFDALLVDGVATGRPVAGAAADPAGAVGNPVRTAATAPPEPTRASQPGPTSGATAATSQPVPGTPPGSDQAGISFPQRGTERWSFATVRGEVAGNAGELLRYRVAVEDGITNLDVELFGREVATILADERGWTADGRWRLQRVGAGSAADFTIHLATPVTRSRLCGDLTDRYTSCRNGDRVVLNVARWVNGVPHFGDDLETYRRYLVNHEVGHRLGRGHELCPRAGGPAPVMQQQTLGLHGCLPNAWPQVAGRQLTGPSGQYDDPIPSGS